MQSAVFWIAALSIPKNQELRRNKPPNIKPRMKEVLPA
jgi:hypothetical protein